MTYIRIESQLANVAWYDLLSSMRKRNSKCMIYYSFLNWVHLWREKKKNKKLLLFHCVLCYLKSQNRFYIIPYHPISTSSYILHHPTIYRNLLFFFENEYFFFVPLYKEVMQKETKKTVISFLETHIFSAILYPRITLYWRKV